MSTIIRLSLDSSEMDNVTFLLRELNITTSQKLIRHLLAKAAQERREFLERYSGGKRAVDAGSAGAGPTDVPRETIPQRQARIRRELEALSDEELTVRLSGLAEGKFFEGYAYDIAEDEVYVTHNKNGIRVLQVARQGDKDSGQDTPMDLIFQRIFKERLIP